MSLEHSRKLIKEIADRREAEDYIEGLLKDPEVRAEAAETSSKWDTLTQDTGIIAPEPPQPNREIEMER